MAPKRVTTKRKGGEAIDSSPVPEKKVKPGACPVPEKKGKVELSIEAVAKAIESADLPENCKAMLLSMVPVSLDTAVENRHDLQAMAVTMISDVMATERAAMEQAIRDEEAKLNEVEASRGGLDSKVTDADQELAERVVKVEERKKVLAVASQEVLSAKAGAAEAKEAQRRSAIAADTLVAEKKAVEAILEEHFKPLKDGTWEAAQVHISALLPLAKRIDLDASLVSAMPSSCTKKPEERGPFDQMVITQLEETLLAKVASLTEQVEAAGPEGVTRAAAAEAALEALESSKARQQQAASDVFEVQAAQREAAGKLEAAKATLANYEPAYKQATEVRDQKKTRLETFLSWNVAAFELLRDRREQEEQEAPAKEITSLDAMENAHQVAVGGS